MGEILRKLASIVFLISTSETPEQEIGLEDASIQSESYNSKHFKDLQLGLSPNGCEIIIHDVRASLEQFPDVLIKNLSHSIYTLEVKIELTSFIKESISVSIECIVFVVIFILSSIPIKVLM